jgi:hypothetical protein
MQSNTPRTRRQRHPRQAGSAAYPGLFHISPPTCSSLVLKMQRSQPHSSHETCDQSSRPCRKTHPRSDPAVVDWNKCCACPVSAWSRERSLTCIYHHMRFLKQPRLVVFDPSICHSSMDINVFTMLWRSSINSIPSPLDRRLCDPSSWFHEQTGATRTGHLLKPPPEAEIQPRRDSTTRFTTKAVSFNIVVSFPASWLSGFLSCSHQ